MTIQEIISAIAALTEVVKVNSGLLGSESAANIANTKIKELIKKLNV